MTVEPFPNICELRAPSWLVPRAVHDDERVESGYVEARKRDNDVVTTHDM